MMHLRSLLLGMAMVAAGAQLHAHEAVGDRERQVIKKVIEGVPVTGANSYCGESIFRFPAPFPQDLQLIFMGEYNPAPNATDVIPLTGENCRADTVLATTSDPGLVELLGGEDADPRLKNRKLRDVPTYLGPDGVRRLLPRVADSDAMFPPVKVDGEKDITLGQWAGARGRMTILCHGNRKSRIHIRFRNIIPNSIYTLWGMYATVPPGQFQRQLIPIPLGGVPNAMSSDGRGHGEFERTLNGCPLNVLSDGSELMMVILNYHADGSIYGGDPDVGTVSEPFILEDGVEFMSTHPAGILNHDQLIFPVRLLEYQ